MNVRVIRNAGARLRATARRAATPLSLAAATALCALSSGCIIVADDGHDHWVDDDWDGDGIVDPAFDAEPATVGITPGANVGAVDPGVGAGLFVEVNGDGLWHVFVTCDTEVSGYACGWEVDVRGEDLEVVDEDDLELEDDVDDLDDEAVAWFDTDFGVDGIWFTTAPGAEVELTMLLDGRSQPTLVYWVGDGVQNEGAPTNPVVFAPR
jgi:hypothetical protein